jgi:hypothetical protein
VKLDPDERDWLRAEVDRRRREEVGTRPKVGRTRADVRERLLRCAETYLRETLADGPRPCSDVLREAWRQGIPQPVLDEARRSVGVVLMGQGVEARWSLPGDEPVSDREWMRRYRKHTKGAG